MTPTPSFENAPLNELQKTMLESNDVPTLEALKAALINRRIPIDASAGILDRSSALQNELLAQIETQVDAKIRTLTIASTRTTEIPAPILQPHGKEVEVGKFVKTAINNPAVQGAWGTLKTIGEWVKGVAVWFGEMWKTTIGPTITRMKDGLKSWLNSMGSGFVTGTSSALEWMGLTGMAKGLRDLMGDTPPTTTPETQQAEDLRKKIENLFPAGIKITAPTTRDVTRFRAAYDRMRMIRAKGIKDRVSVLENEYPDTVYITAVRDYLRTKEPQTNEFTLAKFVDAAEAFNTQEDTKAPVIKPAEK